MKKGFVKNKSVALGPSGEQLDITPQDVRDYSLSFLDDPKSRILILIAQKPNGELLVNTFDTSNRKLYNLLLQAVEQYDTALKLAGV